MIDVTNRNTALCSALVDELARSGVEHAVVAPGSRSAPLALALWKERSITVWSVIDERSAGFVALGIGQATGTPAVVTTTSGTAAANLHPAIAEAAQSRVPLIAITADRPPELRDRGAGQTIDQIKLFGSAVRWFCELGSVEADDEGIMHFRSTACRAFSESLAPSGAPVHLNLPLREPLAPSPAGDPVTANSSLAREGRAEGSPMTQSKQPYVRTPRAVIDSLADLVQREERGLIVAGRQPDAGLPTALAELAALTGYPILAEPLSQARCGPHDRSRVVSHYDTIFRALPVDLAPELILRFGDLPTSKPLRQWLAANDSCHQVLIRQGAGWSDPTSQVDLIERVHAAEFCRDLATTLGDASTRHDWGSRWTAADQAAAAAIDSRLERQTELTEPGLHRRLGAALPRGSTLFVASSMPVRDLETFLPSSDRSLEFLSNRGANGIDGTISTAVGSALASGRHTVVVIGDVALHHDMNALLALRHSGVPMTIVVINNGGGRIFDFLPLAETNPPGYEKLFLTPTNLDSERVASLYDLEFAQLSSYEQLPELLARPGLVEITTDGEANVGLHHALYEEVAAALNA